ncbi:MAG TPA: DUF2066 domain-containing protein [Mesorhizobium sp.]|uniref:DUF2066 domain-containing protein n=1 Tax=Mesorhizobium sp. TaxID=1871066 RepID=UPI002DDD7ACD|nr:DUF2066 domain-containing protein [Mesorhizobium sp.]HEV2503190.1 DUF2066 domain-containing protein [Mesorhizobium sp.]
MKFVFLATAALAAATGCRVSAAEIDRADLYRAQAVTNGFGEANRVRALAPSLTEVLVKVSGDPRLSGDPRVGEMAAHAAAYVKDFNYRDLLNNRPPHDEQGTYDRPQYLTTDFEPDKIDVLLASLARKPWTSRRPAIVALFDIRPMKGDGFALSKDGDAAGAADMRTALTVAARQAGMPLVLPGQDIIRSNRDKKLEVLAGMAKALGGDLVLAGTMAWRDEALGWVADWQLRANGKDYRWQVRGVSFDDAFRNAMLGTAQILSGNGQPEAVTSAR